MSNPASRKLWHIFKYLNEQFLAQCKDGYWDMTYFKDYVDALSLIANLRDESLGW